MYSPQLYENYQLQSGEGVSVLFVYIWILGDVFNLAGAVLGKLIPTIIILGAYVSQHGSYGKCMRIINACRGIQYTTCDFILLGQIFYYRWKTQRKNRAAGGPDALPGDDERTPLIPGSEGSEAVETPESVVQPLPALLAKYSLSVLFVVAVGTGAWWVNEGRYHPDEPNLHGFLANSQGGVEKPNHYALIQFFGWSSAVLFVRAFQPSSSRFSCAHRRRTISSGRAYLKYVSTPLSSSFSLPEEV